MPPKKKVSLLSLLPESSGTAASSSSEWKKHKAKVQQWPSPYALSESLRQFSQIEIKEIPPSLDWSLRVWPGCAIMVVRNVDELVDRERRAVIMKWAEEHLKPGNFDPTGLHQ